MPYGMTICPKCGKEVSCRGLAKHLERDCKDRNEYVPTAREKIKKDKGMLRQAAEDAFPTKQEDPFLPSGRDIKGLKGREETFKNPYRIADKFIKNCITEGVLIPDIKLLAEEGRAEINLKSDYIEIKIYLAKFRKVFNGV